MKNLGLLFLPFLLLSGCTSKDSTEMEDDRKIIETYLDFSTQSSGTLLFFVNYLETIKSYGDNYDFILDLAFINQTKKNKTINITDVTLTREEDDTRYEVSPNSLADITIPVKPEPPTWSDYECSSVLFRAKIP